MEQLHSQSCTEVILSMTVHLHQHQHTMTDTLCQNYNWPMLSPSSGYVYPIKHQWSHKSKDSITVHSKSTNIGVPIQLVMTVHLGARNSISLTGYFSDLVSLNGKGYSLVTPLQLLTKSCAQPLPTGYLYVQERAGWSLHVPKRCSSVQLFQFVKTFSVHHSRLSDYSYLTWTKSHPVIK